jgi:hypothetical protein
MVVYDPRKQKIIDEVSQVYKVGMAPEHGSDWYCEVRAFSFSAAALRAAEMAHSSWAWEATWPLQFLVTDAGGRSRWVVVEREIQPRFMVREMKEVGN